DLPSVRDFEEIGGPDKDAVRDAFSDSNPSAERAVSEPSREELFSKPLYPSTPGRDTPPRDDDQDTREPVEPQPLDETDSEMITDHSAPKPIPMPIPMPRKEATPAPLVLDPEFLVEVPKSEKSEKKPMIPPTISAVSAVSAVKRAPIEERDRRAPVGA